MHKLHFKDTPQEQSARSQKRAGKERDRKRKRNSLDHDDELKRGTSSKRPHANAGGDIPPRKWASSDEDDAGSSYGPHPANSSKIPSDWKENSHKPDYDTIYAQLEEQRFREKMFDALGDDERLDSIEARFNDFGHLPDRWRSARSLKAGEGIRDEDDFFRLDPQNMDEEEYAEWVRTGMYRKTHAAECAEYLRKKAAKAARRAEEKARKAETLRLEKAMKEERQRKKQEQESRRLDYAREEYHMRWKILLSAPGDDDPVGISFHSIPWPVAAAYQCKANKSNDKKRATFSVDDLTAEAISAFLLDSISGRPAEERKKERREKLREAFLRFHPDKFEGRFMRGVTREDEEKVRQAIGQVSRALNVLLSEGQ
ncbi:hypothetical protein K443DRAFT_451405 [Laccaria amethystina LaAM-08-1]|uniref:Uncharacterized protein n=1 Tax=Laccaria amethystina LaAM-08-1 TaxID=1095629 RepID=A0A0C9Y5K1_9AGAR|nr:hypothetical protein K443DRAFT_451405 [Laccaria amethystina LaAM-08-1]